MPPCTPSEAELLEGVIQNVDSLNGEITIVTKDGKTVTLTIATEAPVETDGASSSLETLEPGSHVEVEVDEDGQVATHIKSRQAKIEGVIVPGGIVQLDDGTTEVTIETERGHRRTVLVTDSTRIKLEEDFPGTPADLHVGAEVEVKFDPDSRVAFRIDAEGEEAKIEGVIVPGGIVQLDDGTTEVTIETERGRKLALVVGPSTRIELEDDFPAIPADLREGQEVGVKFDPFTRKALRIEVEEARVREITDYNFRLLISDDRLAIGDFTELLVTIDRVGVQQGGESGGWIEFDAPVDGDGWTVDLTQLQGDNAVEILKVELDDGEYTKVFIHIDKETGVSGVLTSGDPVTLKLPSSKLQIVKPFEIVEGGPAVDFVFDIAVVAAGNVKSPQGIKYLLLPVIGQSGANIPFVEGDTTAPEITVTGVTEGQQSSEPLTITYSATDDTDPDPSVSATLNGDAFTSGDVVSAVDQYELVVTAEDASGKESEVTINFEIVEP